MSDRLTLLRPDDWHIHLRDGAVLPHTVGDAARTFGRAIIMPNLVPPVRNAAEADAYRQRILAARPAGSRFEPLMVLYLTDNTSPEDVRAAKASGFVHAAKLYPAGATTNSDSGVTSIDKIFPALEAMAEVGASTCAINRFIALQRQGLDASAALQEAAAPPGVGRFVSATLHIALSAPTHCVAAAFLHGREHVIPAMFKHILQSEELIQHQAPTLYGYLARHIELDTEDHAPAAQLLLERLVSADPTYPSQAHDTALAAVESRITFWDQVRAALQEARP